jgi:hypothetical protein
MFAVKLLRLNLGSSATALWAVYINPSASRPLRMFMIYGVLMCCKHALASARTYCRYCGMYGNIAKKPQASVQQSLGGAGFLGYGSASQPSSAQHFSGHHIQRLPNSSQRQQIHSMPRASMQVCSRTATTGIHDETISNWNSCLMFVHVQFMS